MTYPTETRFADREAAGQALAQKLAELGDLSGAVVLGLPRGGVPVAAEVARQLHVPLDVINVRKLGVPWQPELAMGAIAEQDIRILHSKLIQKLDVSPEALEAVTDREQATLARRTAQFRRGHPAPELAQRTVILVDDGLATGATMEAAIAAVRKQHPARIIVALPVGPAGTRRHFSALADDCVCLLEPRNFQAVGQWYQQFDQVSDQAVCDLLDTYRTPGHSSIPKPGAT
ncbi:phosphoribosyltransferase [Marinimicrobium sp. C6131]|uniref:phosphoribosyltransferase n=1 Tax=Marinimicrobium sp. C6131 TaxID=3022676 RepID=UPI00223E2937|nr:phosphoribosyltransferase [Marinimicrobium sp. C6131]UZJ43548.1 phosphoribosyltransferase [Marinimicrobium sp. C6131]